MRQSTIPLFSLILAMGFGPRSEAQAPPPHKPLGLPALVALSLDKSPDRRIAFSEVAAARIGTREARTELLPQLTFSEAATRGNDPVYAFGTRLRQQRFTQNDFALNNLNRPLPIGDFTTQFSGSWKAFDSWRTELAIRRADLLLKSTQAASSRADQQIIYRVVTAYESILVAEKQMELAQHQVETAQALLDSSASHVRAGMAVDSDRLSARTNLSARQQEVIAAEGNLAIAWAELERAVGAPIPETERVLSSLAVKQFDRPALADAVTQAMHTRTDRQSLQKQIEAERSGVQMARSAFGPSIAAFGSWQTDRTSFAGSGGNSWLAGAELRIDILPAAKREELSAAKIAQQKAIAAAQSADDQIRLEVTRAWYAQQAAGRMVEVAQASVAESQESLRILRNRYDAGLATVTDLLRAEDAERQSAVSYWQVVSRNELAWADLKFATGTLTPDNLADLQ